MRRTLSRRVWLWWGRWWAVQFFADWREFPLGIRPNWARPMLDIYFGPLSVAVGNHPIMTDYADAGRYSCRGFLINRETPERPVL